MILLSCSNCSYNGLQYGSLGLTVGYCVQHRTVLRRADETTCPRHLRKDLGTESRERAHQGHRKHFRLDVVQFIESRELANSGAVDKDPALLADDSVGEVVTDWGSLTKIATLAQLQSLPGARAELAMLSLGRAYVRTCTLKAGPWTSGLHLFWWTRRRLLAAPHLEVSDFRYQSAAVSMQRQFELAAWSVLMLRLQLLADVGRAAPPDDAMSKLAELDERAAEAVETPDPKLLLAWLEEAGDSLVAAAMPFDRYLAMKEALHDKEGADAP